MTANLLNPVLNPVLNPDRMRIVLVLQGGGALGAYQAGVYQALHEHQLAPDWLVGTSIGAINAALIAGNQEENRLSQLRAFWDRVSHPDGVDMQRISDSERRSAIAFNTADTVLRGVPGFFSPRLFSGFAFNLPVAPEQASFYDTSELEATLDELVDFSYLNEDGGIRLTVNAVNVLTRANWPISTASMATCARPTCAPAAACRPRFRRCASMASCSGTAACIRIRRSNPCWPNCRPEIPCVSWSTCGAPKGPSRPPLTK